MTNKPKNPYIRKKPLNYFLWIVISLFLVILIAIGSYYFFVFKGDLFSTSIKSGQNQGLDQASPLQDESNLTAKIQLFGKEAIEVKIAINPVMIIMIETAINEFIKNLPEELSGIQLITAFKDKDQVLYINFNSELRTKTRFDAHDEYLFLKALYQTIFVNFKSITNVRILVDGKEIESLSGHIILSKGLKEVFE